VILQPIFAQLRNRESFIASVQNDACQIKKGESRNIWDCFSNRNSKTVTIVFVPAATCHHAGIGNSPNFVQGAIIKTASFCTFPGQSHMAKI